MTKLSDLRVSASNMLAHQHSGMLVHPTTVLALIAIAEAAQRMRQSTTMGAEREARTDLDAALKALEAT